MAWYHWMAAGKHGVGHKIITSPFKLRYSRFQNLCFQIMSLHLMLTFCWCKFRLPFYRSFHHHHSSSVLQALILYEKVFDNHPINPSHSNGALSILSVSIHSILAHGQGEWCCGGIFLRVCGPLIFLFYCYWLLFSICLRTWPHWYPLLPQAMEDMQQSRVSSL